MKFKNLLINLHNSVDSFSIKSRHIDMIRQAFPDVELDIVDNKQDFLNKLPGAECDLTWLFQAGWYAGAKRLKAVYTPAAGHDWVTPDPSGQVECHYGRFHGRIMRESLLSMMLYFNRRIDKTVENQKVRQWNRQELDGSRSLFSQQVLIIGYGALGQQMAELLLAFGARVTGVRRTPITTQNGVRLITLDELEVALPEADHIVFVLPGGKATDALFSKAHFNRLKPGAFLYNLGRGNCYCEEDLIAALKGGRLAGAGLDVFSTEPLPLTSPLWDLPNVLITPHSSAISNEYIDLFTQEWIESLRVDCND